MEESKFLFSIIVPVYNTEKYIEKCLNSLIKAMDKDCEVIIINDGSTDKSEEVITKFLSELPSEYKDNFIYKKKENKGLADTKNVGLELARGKYISVVDSDDYISDDFYTIARRYIPDNEIIIYDVYVEFEKSRTLNYVSRAKSDWKEDELVAVLNGAISGSSCNKIIKKDLYKGHVFPVGKQYEDTAVTPFILSESNSIKYVPYPLYHYLQREKSIVATNTLMSAFYKICNNISDVLRDNNLEMDKYKYVINEFVTTRILDILTQDINENKKEFRNNIKGLAEKNKEVINYILETNMLNNIENQYTDRQKQVVEEIFKDLKAEQYGKIEKLLKTREMINRIRRIWR